MRWYMPGMMRSGFVLMTLSSALFWALVVGAVVVVAVLATRPSRPAQLTARQVLDQRYAHGEITKAEYEEMRRTLEA